MLVAFYFCTYKSSASLTCNSESGYAHLMIYNQFSFLYVKTCTVIHQLMLHHHSVLHSYNITHEYFF